MEPRAPRDIVGFLDYYFVAKAPFQIPAAGRQALVRFGPWIAIVILLMTLPAVLYYAGISHDVWWYGRWRVADWYLLHDSPPAAFGFVAEFVLLLMAVPGLFARTRSGWSLAFYARVVGALTSVLSGLIVSGLAGALISLYLLFQVRALYR